MLQDVQELRGNNWVPRQRQEQSLKTIDQVRGRGREGGGGREKRERGEEGRERWRERERRAGQMKWDGVRDVIVVVQISERGRGVRGNSSHDN